MIELELLGTSADGASLVLTGEEGERYSVLITDELRAAVRRDRPRLEAVREDSEHPLSPKEIQTLLRAGASVEDVAGEYHVEIGLVRGFEAPVRAEQDFAVQRALACRIGTDPTSPLMEDLVVDRLAARGVEADTLEWSARRSADSPWEICLTFIQGAAEHGAHWYLSASGTQVEAIDQEARWLTETAAAPRSLFPPVPQIPQAAVPAPEADDAARREALVDQLNAARGRRQDIDLDLDDTDDEDALAVMAMLDEEEASRSTSTIPQIPADARPSAQPADPVAASTPAARTVEDSLSARIYSLANARTHAPTDPTADTTQTTEPDGPDGDDEAEVLPGLDGLTPEPGAERRKGKRRSVPSWDEIVFGSRN